MPVRLYKLFQIALLGPGQVLDPRFKMCKAQEEDVNVADVAELRAESLQLSREVSGCAIRDSILKKPEGGTHAACRYSGLVHELSVDVALDSRKVLAKPLELMGEDLPDRIVEPIIKLHS